MIQKLTAERLNGVKKSGIRKIFDNAPDGAFNLGLGEIQFPTPQIIIQAGKDVLKNEMQSYTPNAGLQIARKAVAEYYNKTNTL